MRISNKQRSSGFTLIELLVVIAIIAVLAIVVVLTLNPAQLIKQARDSNRISDLSSIKSAIAYYQQDVTSQSLGTQGTCYMDGPNNGGTVTTTTCPFFSTASTTVTSTVTRTVAGAGWIPVNLGSISVGSPLGQLPIDPLNTVGHSGGAFVTSTDFLYAYTPGTSASSTFKIAAHMESTKYAQSGSSDVETTDGGTYAGALENGTNLAL